MEANNQFVLDTKATANKLRLLKPELLKRFAEQSKRELASSRQTDHRSLIDSLPAFIDDLCEALNKGNISVKESKISDVGKEHGRERASLEQYDLIDVIEEYRIFDHIIFDILRKDNFFLDRTSERIILDAIHKGIANASSEFVKIRDEESVLYEKERSRLITVAEKAHQEMHNFFMQSPEPMCILSGKEHRYTLANPAYQKLIGNKIIGKTVSEVFPQDMLRFILPALDGVIETGKTYVGREVSINIPDENGNLNAHWLDFSYHPSRDAEGKIRGILVLVVDVTEQVKSRNTISESEQRFKLISEQSPQIIWTTDATGKITFLNQHWFDLTGLTFKEAEESGWEGALHEDDVEKITELFKHSLKSGEDFHADLRFLRKSDKRYIWYACRARAIRDLHGNITQWIGVANDIEEHKSLVKKLEEERDIRTRFVSTLSHDLRTPLTAAKMSAQMLARKMNEPEPQKVLCRISDMMDRADKMIRDLLDANLIKVGEKLPLKIEHLNIVRVASDTLEELAGIHGDRFVLKETEPIEGHWDEDALRRIIDNLGSNAVKYGYAGTKIIVGLKQEDTKVILDIFNEGPYISESDQMKMFDQFKRVESAKKAGAKGWGLGLTLVKGLVEAQNGSVRVSSAEGKGTTFTIELPLDARETV